MRAFVLPEFGSTPEVQDIEIPTPDAGEVLVRVRAASVNGFDLAVANGYLNGMMEHRFPVVLGKDFAGSVEAVGADVGGFAVGDRVFGVVMKPFLGDGSFAEYVTVPVAVGLAKLPDGIDFTTGAALGLAGTAAVDGFDAAEIAPGQIVLVAGATGGVGNQVVQLAAKAGAHVIATARAEQERTRVADLGAAEIVDYTEDVASQVHATHPEGVDAIIHLAGDPASLLPALTSNGRFVSTLLGSPDQVDAGARTVVPVMANPAPATLDRLADNNASGHTSVTVQHVYDLESASDAFAAFGQGTLGKLIIAID
jgi:NADPH:quinone reductase-like Zn-dependent oxidoreductase